MSDVEVITDDDVIVIQGEDASSIILTLEEEVEVIHSLGPVSEVPSTRTINAGVGLTGGGDLSADRTIALSAGTQTAIDAKVAKAGDTMTGALTSSAVIQGQAIYSVTSGSAPGWAASLKVKYAGGGTEHGAALQPIADTTTAIMMLNAAGSGVGSISVTAAATAFNTSSDVRLKEDLKTFDAARIIEATEVYSFAWKTGGRAYGVSAQQANEVFPEAVTYDEKNDWWGIDYSKYIPIVLQELKALRARVAQLEAQVAPK